MAALSTLDSGAIDETAAARKGGPPPLPSKDKNRASAAESDVMARCTGMAALDAGLSDLDKYAALEEQLNALEKAHQHERNAKKGLEALIGFYRDDPAAKRKAEIEVQDSAAKLEAIKARIDQIRDERNSLAPKTEGRIRSYTADAPKPVDELPTLCKATAAFAYDATNDQELSFKEGDVLEIKQQDESGWWWASLNGKEGFAASTYLDVIEG